MIISKLTGGLGNQLFQYAIGRSLAICKNTIFKMDISFYSSNENKKLNRKYLLDKFNISESIASNNELKEIVKKKHLKRAILRNVCKRQIPYYKENIVVEQTLSFDKNLFNINKNTILEGYWPNEKYFLPIQHILQKEFILQKEYITPLFSEYQSAINSKNAISIHIRRTDYLNMDDGTHNLFGICDLEYYNNAINFILSKVDNPFFYIFTDDAKWVVANFKLDYPFYIISENKFQDYEELQLMSFCKHNIIANSTFSWWGAWLNKYQNKIIVAPQKWYNNENYQEFYEKSDFVPKTWIRI